MILACRLLPLWLSLLGSLASGPLHLHLLCLNSSLQARSHPPSAPTSAPLSSALRAPTHSLPSTGILRAGTLPLRPSSPKAEVPWGRTAQPGVQHTGCSSDDQSYAVRLGLYIRAGPSQGVAPGSSGVGSVREGPRTGNASGGLSDATCPPSGETQVLRGPACSQAGSSPGLAGLLWMALSPSNCGCAGKALCPQGPLSLPSVQEPQQHPPGASHRPAPAGDPEMSTRAGRDCVEFAG